LLPLAVECAVKSIDLADHHVMAMSLISLDMDARRILLRFPDVFTPHFSPEVWSWLSEFQGATGASFMSRRDRQHYALGRSPFARMTSTAS
jgi:hypothetical protein